MPVIKKVINNNRSNYRYAPNNVTMIDFMYILTETNRLSRNTYPSQHATMYNNCGLGFIAEKCIWCDEVGVETCGFNCEDRDSITLESPDVVFSSIAVRLDRIAGKAKGGEYFAIVVMTYMTICPTLLGFLHRCLHLSIIPC